MRSSFATVGTPRSPNRNHIIRSTLCLWFLVLSPCMWCTLRALPFFVLMGGAQCDKPSPAPPGLALAPTASIATTTVVPAEASTDNAPGGWQRWFVDEGRFSLLAPQRPASADGHNFIAKGANEDTYEVVCAPSAAPGERNAADHGRISCPDYRALVPVMRAQGVPIIRTESLTVAGQTALLVVEGHGTTRRMGTCVDLSGRSCLLSASFAHVDDETLARTYLTSIRVQP